MEVLQARTTDSFATAATSSPLSEPPSSDNALRATGNNLTPRSYRSVNELPFELAQHVQTYYEETLFTQAFDFLISLVSNSISSRDPSAPILLPGPPHLALAATVSLHPAIHYPDHRKREMEPSQCCCSATSSYSQHRGSCQCQCLRCLSLYQILWS